ncbi:MAG TPA: FHA domain-containing protein [Myxococcota bacterium]|jgi:hypothetical protein|nr:FHA domain-containing protein [Myxococcota bacterium]
MGFGIPGGFFQGPNISTYSIWQRVWRFVFQLPGKIMGFFKKRKAMPPPPGAGGAPGGYAPPGGPPGYAPPGGAPPGYGAPGGAPPGYGPPGGRSSPPPAARSGMPQGWGELGPVAKKTMAIDLNAMGMSNEIVGVVGWLVAMDGNHKGQDFRLHAGKNIIGTAADCDIVITDSYISSKHANIKFENEQYVLIDLDSTNGTCVNDHRITKEELIDNDVVRLGRTNLKFKALF